MAKVKVEMTLDVPFEGTQAEVEQLMFDTVINYVNTRHLMDAIRYLSKDHEKLYEHHALWGDIATKMVDSGQYKITVVEE